MLCALALAAAVLLVALAAACSGGGANEPDPTPTFTALPTATSTPAATPTLEPGQRRRWGYDPLKPTGELDEQIPFVPLPREYSVERIVAGLDRPTQLVAAPDGTIFIAQQAGDVRVIQAGHLVEEPWLSLDVYLPELDEQVELGLTGIALHPNYSANGYVYLYYAQPEPRRTVIARAQEIDDETVELTPLISWPASQECCHQGGGMRFGPDGKLYVGVGDHEIPGSAQDPSTLTGAILRLNPDGSAPDDNPFAGLEGVDARIYAYGLRNPYDIAIDSDHRRFFTGENGFFGQDAIIELDRGGNYGWPGANLYVTEDLIKEPIRFYHQYAGLAGMEFYDGVVLAEFTDSLLYCRFHNGTLNQLTFFASGRVEEERSRARNCTSDVITGSDGFLYYLDYVDGALYRISTNR